MDTGEPQEVRLVMDGAAVYLLRGEERTLVLAPALFSGDTTARSVGAPEEQGRRVVLARGEGLREWYEARGRDLEQGWTLDDAPEGTIGSLRVRLELGPEVRQEREVVEGLRASRREGARDDDDESDDAGPSSGLVDLRVDDVPISYSDLVVRDARGEIVPAELAVLDDAVEIVVQHQEAPFPLTIDPIIALSATTLSVNNHSLQWGTAAAMSGTHLFVGQRDRPATSNRISGAVHQYHWTGTSWTFVREIRINGTGSAAFGASVAVHGDWLVVGAPEQASNQGRAYAIRLSSGFSGNLPNLLRTLMPAVSVFNFGAAVSVSGSGGSRIAVGCVSNRVFVHNRSGTSWPHSQTLTGSGFYGAAVALDPTNPNLLVVGAPNQNTVGRVHVHEWSGASWSSAVLIPQHGDQTRFGVSVAVHDGLIGIATLAFHGTRAEFFRANKAGSSWVGTTQFMSTGYISTTETYSLLAPGRYPTVAIARDPLGGSQHIQVLGLPNGVQASNGSGAVQGTVDVRPPSLSTAARTTFGCCTNLGRGRLVLADQERVLLGYTLYWSPRNGRVWSHAIRC